MKVIDQIGDEIDAASETLARRLDSSADDAEKAVVRLILEEFEREWSDLKKAAPLQAADSLASATEALERAVAAVRHGPFDGYLAAIESHFTKLNRFSAKLHAVDGLKSAIVRATRGTSSKRNRAAKPSRSRAALESLPPGLLTSTKFSDLKDEYQSCYDRCTTRPESGGNVAYYVKRLKQGQLNYQQVESEVRVPWAFVGVIHGMECGFNFAGHLHNGDKLTARTVNVPKGYPKVGDPPFTWLQSALDALRLKKLDQVTDWSLPHMLYLLEGYNGFGYRRRGLPTPYLWSFSNVYEKGKFVADGKFDPEAVSKQCGAALMLKAVLTV